MRDLNFFEPYIDKKQFKFDRLVLLYGLLFIVILGLIIFAGVNKFEINALEKEVKTLSEVANDPETVKRVTAIKAFEDETSQFREEVENIRILDKNIQARDVIGEDILEQINTKLPNGVFLTNISISGRTISISGFGEDRYSIAEFTKGLEELPTIYSTFVSNISAVESYYSFNIDVELEEVLVDVS